MLQLKGILCFHSLSPCPDATECPKPVLISCSLGSALWEHQANGHHSEHGQGLSSYWGQGHCPLPLHQDPRVPAHRPAAGVPRRPHQGCRHHHQGMAPTCVTHPRAGPIQQGPCEHLEFLLRTLESPSSPTPSPGRAGSAPRWGFSVPLLSCYRRQGPPPRCLLWLLSLQCSRFGRVSAGWRRAMGVDSLGPELSVLSAHCALCRPCPWCGWGIQQRLWPLL